MIGPEQRLTPAEALRAVTLDAAYQHFEDDRKGSLEVGKLADMAVLSANPLRVAPDGIKEIEVLATLKEGVPIHVRERARAARTRWSRATARAPLSAARRAVGSTYGDQRKSASTRQRRRRTRRIAGDRASRQLVVQ